MGSVPQGCSLDIMIRCVTRCSTGVWVLVWTLALGISAAASDPIEEILVVGARLPRPVQDVVGTVDVITRSALIEDIALDSADVVRYTPGVSVARADTRFGATEFTIRGLSGNRVTTLIDGVPVSDQFDIGAFSNAGQDYLAADTISRVEILRGPASTLFGSDALGGVVAVVTRDPEEYLEGGDFATSAAAAYSGADHGGMVSGSLAAGSGPASGVFHVSHQRSRQRDAAGTGAENPLDRERSAALVKVHVALRGGDALRFKAELFDESVDSRPEGVLGYGRQFASTTALVGDDSRRRLAAQGEYEFAVAGRWADVGRFRLYAQRSEVEQVTDERRDLADPPVAIRRGFDYRFDDSGIMIDLESPFELAGLDHRLGWGGSLRRSRVEELRSGLQRDLGTGTVTHTLLGETLPVRDFPNSTIIESAVYLHDEISAGRITVIPGVRFEHYRLDGHADGVYREDYPDTVVEDVSESAVVPKLGLQWRLADDLDVFLQYARGFRAPPFEDVNIGLHYTVPFDVRAIPNPELEAETSDGVELGVRFRGPRVTAGFTLFGADYDEFIESKASLGFDPASGALLFQSRNIDRARVYGAELSLSAPLTSTLTIDAAGNWTRGENRVSGEPLNTVDPPELTTRLTWRPASRWRAGLAVRAVASMDRVDETRADLFEPDGYVAFDLTAGYSPSDAVRIDAGIFNLTDETYWRWASVRGRPETDPLVELLAAPGRYGAVSLHVTL